MQDACHGVEAGQTADRMSTHHIKTTHQAKEAKKCAGHLAAQQKSKISKTHQELRTKPSSVQGSSPRSTTENEHASSPRTSSMPKPIKIKQSLARRHRRTRHRGQNTSLSARRNMRSKQVPLGTLPGQIPRGCPGDRVQHAFSIMEGTEHVGNEYQFGREKRLHDKNRLERRPASTSWKQDCCA